MAVAQASRLLLVSPGPQYIPACCSTGSHFAQQQIRAHAPLPDLTLRHEPAWQLEQRRNSPRPSCSCSKFRIFPIPAQFQSLTDLQRWRNSFSGRGHCPRPRSVRTPAYSQLYMSLIGRCVGLLPVSDAWTGGRPAAVFAAWCQLRDRQHARIGDRRVAENDESI